MSRFLTPLHHSRTGPREAVILADFRYASDLAGQIITVPEGFVYDGASVPRAVWSIVRPFGRTLRAAVIHDWLYERRGRWNVTLYLIRHADTGEAARELADDIFREAMMIDSAPPWNISWFQRNGSYRAVRAFGGKAWRT